MKKKSSTKKNRPASDFDSLNAELGSSFGLEPPKRYRRDQTVPTYGATEPKKKAPARKRSAAPKHRKHRPNSHPSEKEQLKLRKQRKKMRKALSILGVMLAIIIVIVVLSLTVFFKIDTISVTGSTKYSDKEVTAVLPFERSDNLFLIDKKGTAARLTKNLPYIYNVDISRKLPSTVTITITEPKRTYAIRNNDDTYTILDDRLKILEQSTKKRPSKAIEIRNTVLKKAVPGEKAAFNKKNTAKSLSSIISVINSVGLNEATAIYTDGPDSNYIVYDNRITIKLGAAKDMEKKLYSALAAIDRLNKTNPTVKGEIASYGGKQVYFTEKK